MSREQAALLLAADIIVVPILFLVTVMGRLGMPGVLVSMVVALAGIGLALWCLYRLVRPGTRRAGVHR